MRRTRTFPLLMALAAMTSTVRAEELPLFRLEMKDGVVSPLRLEVPAGKRFRLEIRNTGKVAAEFECKPLKKEKVLTPGTTALLEINTMSSGEYTFVDEFHENLPTGRGLIVVN